MRNCNGNCAFCFAPCQLNQNENEGKQRKLEEIPTNSKTEVTSISSEEEKGAEKAFDEPMALAIIEKEEYELVKPIFRKERVRRVK